MLDGYYRTTKDTSTLNVFTLVFELQLIVSSIPFHICISTNASYTVDFPRAHQG